MQGLKDESQCPTNHQNLIIKTHARTYLAPKIKVFIVTLSLMDSKSAALSACSYDTTALEHFKNKTNLLWLAVAGIYNF